MAGKQVKLNLRDRVVEMKRIPSSELLPHPANPRHHPSEQKAVMKGILDQIGIADVLVVYKSARANNRYVIIDGHMRATDFQADWPCAVTDLTDDEADLLIQAHDQVGQLALTDAQTIRQLKEKAEFDDKSVRMMLDRLAGDSSNEDEEKGGEQEQEQEKGRTVVPEMELLPYEHYDYVLVVCRKTFDWTYITAKLGLQRVAGTNDDRYRPKIGLGRAIPADKLIEHFRQGEEDAKKFKDLRQKLYELTKDEQYKPADPLAEALMAKAAALEVAPPVTDDDFERARKEFK
jgi:hypothetical protein